MAMALIVREKQVRELLSMRDTVTVLEDAFHAQSQGLVMNQPRTRLAFAKWCANGFGRLCSYIWRRWF